MLVVDDNDTSREILLAYLRGRIARCDAAHSGDQALAMLGMATYDVVLLDSDMPDRSGAAVASEIRANPAWRDVRIVMLTSAGQAGAERFLTKPVRRGALLDMLAEVMSQPAAAPAAASTPAPVAPRGRVLVAEDNPVNQLVIETQLRRHGFDVDIASDGLEAVARLDPDVHLAVFMDCQMPNLDGYQATARIRAGEAADQHIPIIAMTAHAFAGDRERCLQAGMDDYLPKPLRTEALEPVLERWLARPAKAVADALVDAERARSVLGMGTGKLLEVFARTTPPLIAELRTAVERGDAPAASKLAHKLRSSTETVGATRLAALARQLELGNDTEAAAAELDPTYRATLEELLRLSRQDVHA